MWIKFADRLVNFDHVQTVKVEHEDYGSNVALRYDDDTAFIEQLSTPRAAQDRFDALAAMLTGEAITLGVKR